MKKIFLLLIILLSLVVTGCDDTFTSLDKIHEYKITVNPNDDGTLKMKYYLKWEVLEEGDGGVDFITVGVANRFVYDIKGLTNNIDEIDGFRYGIDGPVYFSKIAGNTIIFASFLVITLVGLVLLFKSRHGRAILSIREDAIASAASGIPVKKYKIFTFALSAGIAGLAGGLYYHFASSLGTNLFAQDRSIELLVFVVLGGLGSFTGTILSTVVLTFISYKLLLNSPGGYQQLIYGVILILIMLLKPNGLMGTGELTWDGMKSFLKKIFNKIFKKKAKVEQEENYE